MQMRFVEHHHVIKTFPPDQARSFQTPFDGFSGVKSEILKPRWLLTVRLASDQRDTHPSTPRVAAAPLSRGRGPNPAFPKALRQPWRTMDTRLADRVHIQGFTRSAQGCWRPPERLFHPQKTGRPKRRSRPRFRRDRGAERHPLPESVRADSAWRRGRKR